MLKYNRVIVAISGATGVEYAVRILKVLKANGIEVHMVISKPGEMTRSYETDYTSKEIKELADFVHPNADIGASISSGLIPRPLGRGLLILIRWGI